MSDFCYNWNWPLFLLYRLNLSWCALAVKYSTPGGLPGFPIPAPMVTTVSDDHLPLPALLVTAKFNDPIQKGQTCQLFYLLKIQFGPSILQYEKRKICL